MKSHNTSTKPLCLAEINKILNYKHGKARFFNTIAGMTNIYHTVCPSQTTTSGFAGNYCRSWGNHIINEIANDGSIKLTKQGKQLTSKGKKSFKDKTLIMDLPDEFYYYENRILLAPKYPAFRIWTPVVRERAIRAKAKNLTQLSSSIFINKNIYLININNLENGASENNKRILNKISTKKGNIEAKNNDASIDNLQETITPYRKEYAQRNSLRSKINWYDYEDTPHSAPPPRIYNPNKDRVYATKNGTKHFDLRYHFPHSEEEYEAERNEYLTTLGYKSKLDDPTYNPMVEVKKIQAAIQERDRSNYLSRYPNRTAPLGFLNMDEEISLEGYAPVSDEERAAFRAELIKNFA